MEIEMEILEAAISRLDFALRCFRDEVTAVLFLLVLSYGGLGTIARAMTGNRMMQ